MKNSDPCLIDKNLFETFRQFFRRGGLILHAWRSFTGRRSSKAFRKHGNTELINSEPVATQRAQKQLGPYLCPFLEGLSAARCNLLIRSEDDLNGLFPDFWKGQKWRDKKHFPLWLNNRSHWMLTFFLQFFLLTFSNRGGRCCKTFSVGIFWESRFLSSYSEIL